MSRHFDQAEGVSEQHDSETHPYVLNQTMMRIKDPKRSLKFYSEVMGMTLVKRLDFPEMEFSLYFMAALSPEQRKQWSTDHDQRIKQTFSRPAMLELTHNWGDEEDDSVNFHSGNSDPKGFGHIGFAVPDVEAACERFDDMDVEFQKRPQEGKMKGIAFIKDPDGYWIEIFAADNMPDLLSEHL